MRLNKMYTVGSGIGSRGFTFIEVLIAITVLGIGIVAAMSMQGFSVGGNATANRITQGSAIAAERVEYLANLPYGDSLLDVAGNPHAGPADDGYVLSWTVADDTPAADTKTITLIVTKTIGTSSNSITVVFVKAKIT